MKIQGKGNIVGSQGERGTAAPRGAAQTGRAGDGREG